MTELAVLGATAATAAPWLAAGWLIDKALLPALRPLLAPLRPALERKYPAKGRHTHHGKESSAELEVGRPDHADHGQPAQHRPDHRGDAAGRTPDSGSGAG